MLIVKRFREGGRKVATWCASLGQISAEGSFVAFYTLGQGANAPPSRQAAPNLATRWPRFGVSVPRHGDQAVPRRRYPHDPDTRVLSRDRTSR